MSLIVFEGIDGTGKTTCADKLLVYLVSKGLDCAKFSEPSHSKYGMKIRNAMNGKKRLSVERETELFVKDRKVDVKENIKPALKEGKIVLLDRYYFSTAAYQGSRMMMNEWQAAMAILTRNEQFSPIPDLRSLYHHIY
jgi:dTMP kinase